MSDELDVNRYADFASSYDALPAEDWIPLYNELLETRAILAWVEAGFPPWGCDACRGAEYGPDGHPCVSCGGHSEAMEPPPRAQALQDQFHQAIGRASRLVAERSEIRDAITRLTGKPEDAPYLTCSGCGRKSWSDAEGNECNMVQSDKTYCGGRFYKEQPLVKIEVSGFDGKNVYEGFVRRVKP